MLKEKSLDDGGVGALAAVALPSLAVFAAAVSQANFAFRTNDAISADIAVDGAAIDKTNVVEGGAGARTEVRMLDVVVSEGERGDRALDEDKGTPVAAADGVWLGKRGKALIGGLMTNGVQRVV